MQKPWLAGGMACVPIDWNKERDDYLHVMESDTDVLDLTDDIKDKVKELLNGIRRYIRTSAKRKVVPTWAIPAELLLLMLYPNWRAHGKYAGLGICFDKIKVSGIFKFFS